MSWDAREMYFLVAASGTTIRFVTVHAMARYLPRRMSEAHRSSWNLYAGNVVSRLSSTGPPTVKW